MGSPIINFEPDFQLDFQLDFQPDIEQPSLLRSSYGKSIIPKPKVEEFENVTLPDGSTISKRRGETVEQARQRLTGRPDTSTFDLGRLFDVTAENISNKIGLSDVIPEWLKPKLATAAVYGFTEIPRSITDIISQPENIVTPS